MMTFEEFQEEEKRKVNSTLKRVFIEVFNDAKRKIEKCPYYQENVNPLASVVDVDYEQGEVGMIKWPDLSKALLQNIDKKWWMYHEESSGYKFSTSSLEFGEEIVGLNCYHVKNVAVIFSENTKVLMKIKKDLSEETTTFEEDFDMMLKTFNAYEGVISSDINISDDCQIVVVEFDIKFFN